MTAPTFHSAVQIAKSYIEENRTRNGFDITKPIEEETFIAARAALILEFDAGYGFLDPLNPANDEFDIDRALNFWDEAVCSTVRNSESYLTSFKMLQYGIAAQIESGKELHPKLRQWLMGFLRGRIVAPKRRRGRMPEAGAHGLVAHAVAHLVDLGITATRNDASEATSACDAVAAAMGSLGLSPNSFDGVSDVWSEWRRGFGGTSYRLMREG